jgi:hypothetical protein
MLYYPLFFSTDLGNGWYRYGEAALKPFKDLKTWLDARSYCQSLGGDLVSISSDHENDFIYNMFVKDLINNTNGKWYTVLLRNVHQIQLVFVFNFSRTLMVWWLPYVYN